MRIRSIVSWGFLAATALLVSPQPPQTGTDGDGNKLTYSANGIKFTGIYGSTKQLPAAWLNENCPDPSKAGITDSNDLSALKGICDGWRNFNEQGTDSSSIVEPPTVIPDNCSISEVVFVSAHGHSDAYNLLGYEIAALYVGHNAEGNNAVALKSMKSDFGADPTGMLADVFQNLNIATDEYRCGAFIEGKYQATDESRQTDRATMISVFNRLAIINSRMKDYVEDRFKNIGNQDTTTVLNNANTLANLTNDRKAAFSDLVSAMTLSSFLSYYMGDPSAKIADRLDMSSAEREQLLNQLDRMQKTGSPDGFTEVADLLKTFLNSHPKVHQPTVDNPRPAKLASVPDARRKAEQQEPEQLQIASEPVPIPCQTFDSLPAPEHVTMDGFPEKYQAALQNFYNANYEEARAKFGDVSAHDPDPELAAAAQFYIGEISYQQHDYVGAINAFNSILAKHSDSVKAPSAQLHCGLSLLSLKRQTEAIQVLRSLIKNHPRTPEAGIARIQLIDAGFTVNVKPSLP